MVRVVHVVIIDRGQTREHNRAADERTGAHNLAEDLFGIERRSFDRKFLPGIQSIPGEVACLRECTHVAGAEGNLRTPSRNRRSKNSANERYCTGSNSLMSM